ncbi:unnamed protein product [Spirodela intermedia]|uniref:Fe2OG dioxygenase domain-containing protein n=1 Tax=Spirodela intermedia TaxID=51605 RepID=A0A7I8JE72_SPIIN|nr:unnamed protein product [Spirodela intermedia]CAA6668436.1 unnamed protein product [Spirodela intermedia]
MQKKNKIPREFIWPSSERLQTLDELAAPVVDLGGFLSGDEESTLRAAGLVAAACKVHGFFQVTNHGVDLTLIAAAVDCLDAFFRLPSAISSEPAAPRQPLWLRRRPCAPLLLQPPLEGDPLLPPSTPPPSPAPATTPWVYQRYCEAMEELSLAIMDLLGVSLGWGGTLQERLRAGSSIMRCNYYPACPEPELAMGTGPHCDPTAMTVLHQDLVGGLEVFSGGRWRAVNPVSGALVVNIGDTFMALSNGRYKSCLHRAVVNRNQERRSIAFFLCPRDDELLRPPEDLVGDGAAAAGDRRKYPDFTWSELKEFTQKHYRADTKTLQSFSEWLLRPRRSS